MNTFTMMAMAVVAGTLGGCLDDGGRGVALTRAQLSERLAGGAQRLEVKLRADGSVREVEVQDEGSGHDAHFAGRLVSMDVEASKLVVEHLGTVDFAAAGRFRTDEDSRVERTSWLSAVESALAANRTVWVDARGRFGPEVFVAHEVRWEDDAVREVEADVSASDFDAATGRLTIGWLVFDLQGASIRTDDGGGSGDDDGEDVRDSSDGHDDDDDRDSRGDVSGDGRDSGPSDDDGDDDDGDDGDDDDGDVDDDGDDDGDRDDSDDDDD